MAGDGAIPESPKSKTLAGRDVRNLCSGHRAAASAAAMFQAGTSLEGSADKAPTPSLDLLTTMMIYWVTESFVTSVRYYYEARRHPWTPTHTRTPVIEAPTGIAVFPKELLIPPKRWAEQYYNLKRWTVMTAGGHFAHAEEPEQLVQDVRAFFRQLRE